MLLEFNSFLEVSSLQGLDRVWVAPPLAVWSSHVLCEMPSRSSVLLASLRVP